MTLSQFDLFCDLVTYLFDLHSCPTNLQESWTSACLWPSLVMIDWVVLEILWNFRTNKQTDRQTGSGGNKTSHRKITRPFHRCLGRQHAELDTTDVLETEYDKKNNIFVPTKKNERNWQISPVMVVLKHFVRNALITCWWSLFYTINMFPILGFPPRIGCSNITVPNGSRNQKITCIVVAHPEVTHAFWVWNETHGRMTLDIDRTHKLTYASSYDVLVSNHSVAWMCVGVVWLHTIPVSRD